MTTNRDVLAERVNRGAEWLDKVRPEWWTEIDVGTLDLRNGCRCVLGQVVGSAVDADGVVLNGFALLCEVTEAAEESFVWSHGFIGFSEEYDALDELWIAQIKARWSGERVAMATTDCAVAVVLRTAPIVAALRLRLQVAS